MKCKKCGEELPDLSMYCTRCGAKQFEAEEREIQLELPDKKGSKVIIQSCRNITNDASKIHGYIGFTIPEARKLLQNTPAVLLSGLDEEEAIQTAEMLQEGGVDAIAVLPEESKTTEPVESKREPIEEPAITPVPVEESVVVVNQEDLIEESAEVQIEETLPEDSDELESQPYPVDLVEEKEEVIEEKVDEDIVSDGQIELSLKPQTMSGKDVDFDQEDEEKEEFVPQLTLNPKSDEEFMKEMEEFLNNKES